MFHVKQGDKMRKILVLKNHHAGTRSQEHHYQHLLEELKKQYKDVTVDETLYPRYFIDKYKDIDFGYTDVISCGGDGTLYETVNAFVDKDVTISIFPIGSANDLYSYFYKPIDYPSLIRRILSEEAIEIDVMKIDEYYSINVAGIGVDVKTLQIREILKKYMWGKLAYQISALGAFAYDNSMDLNIELDGKIINGNFLIVTLCNGKYFGGNMMISPKSVINDGYIDIIMLEKTNKAKLVNFFTKIYKGTHLEDPLVKHYRAKEVKITSNKDQEIQMEGEIVDHLPLRAVILENKLRIIT